MCNLSKLKKAARKAAKRDPAADVAELSALGTTHFVYAEGDETKVDVAATVELTAFLRRGNPVPPRYRGRRVHPIEKLAAVLIRVSPVTFKEMTPQRAAEWRELGENVQAAVAWGGTSYFTGWEEDDVLDMMEARGRRARKLLADFADAPDHEKEAAKRRLQCEALPSDGGSTRRSRSTACRDRDIHTDLGAPPTIQEVLLELFGEGGLRRVVWYLPGDLSRSMPGREASPRTLAFELVSLARRHGCLQELRDHCVRERPQRAAYILSARWDR